MNKAWIKAALIRALRTFAQNFGSLMTVDGAVNGGFADFDWMHMLSVATVSAIYSIVMALAGLPEAPVKKEDDVNA